ncbi:hypothetical protein [Pedobacter frigoris]|uniref:hypothetical protein n=1 Tax=Pedobacter frigoris TaxID=2571272 RepID=UPI0029319D42|nr:hypothetical protein [Pedobacter frigoris]
MDLNSVQSDSQFFIDAMDVCCQKIVEKMGDKPISEWRSADYNTLSALLGKKTKIYLSENTLKRILGRLKTSKRYYPQKATRDALAQFIGYRDWQEFELVCMGSRQKTKISVEPEKTKETEAAKAINKVKVKPYVQIGVLMAFVVVVVALFNLYNRDAVSKDVKLICENPFGTVPHTAVFRLSGKAAIDQGEEFQIDFMDEALVSNIKGEKNVTKFFRNPGVVYATLLRREQPIDTVAVFLQTKGWVANSGNDTSRAYPINGLGALNPKNIYVSPEQLDSAGLDTTKPFLVGFSNIRPSKINGDNFDFSCKVFAEQSRPGTQCIETTFIILGEKHRHLLKLYRANCVAFSEYKFSENRVLGSEQFLGNLAFNPENGGTVQIKVEDKRASVFINGKKALSTSYRRSIGRVMGIKILFNGIGRAISPKLRDLSTGEIF